MFELPQKWSNEEGINVGGKTITKGQTFKLFEEKKTAASFMDACSSLSYR